MAVTKKQAFLKLIHHARKKLIIQEWEEQEASC